MTDVNTSISNAQQALHEYQNLNKIDRPKKAINSKYKVVAKHPAIADVFLKIISSFLPSHLHFAQTTKESVLKQLNKLKEKSGITTEQKDQINQIIENFKKIYSPDLPAPPTKKADNSPLKIEYEDIGKEVRVSIKYEDKLIGTSKISIEDGKTHVFTFQLLDEYQGKGHGKKAFHEIISFLDNHPTYGRTAYYYMECVAETPASHIYESAGFVVAPPGDPRCTLKPDLVNSGFQTMVREPKGKN